MEIINTTLEEAEALVNSLGREERSMYDIQWEDLAPYIIYLVGAKVDGKLVGISGIYRKYGIVYSSYRVVKYEYWNRGIGTELARNWRDWVKANHIPFVMRQGYLKNTASLYTYAKVLPTKTNIIVGGMHYNINAFTWWGKPLIPIVFAGVIVLDVMRGIKRLFQGAGMPKIKLGGWVLRFLSWFIDYEADHLPVEGRLIEYGYAISRLMWLPKGRVLDVGCIALHNTVSSSLAYAGWEVHGIDVRRDWGFRHPNFTFKQGDIRECGYPDAWFDVVVCVSTLEHVGVKGYYGVKLEDYGGDMAAVKEIVRILKPDGLLIVTVPYTNKYFRRPEERVYDDARLRAMFEGLYERDRQIYTWTDNGWQLAVDGSGKDTMICLEYQKS